MKFEKEKSFELWIDYLTLIWIYQQLRAFSGTCKALAEVSVGTLMGTEWRLFIARDQRGHVTFKRPIFIYKLTLFLTSLLSLLARDTLVIKSVIKISHGKI